MDINSITDIEIEMSWVHPKANMTMHKIWHVFWTIIPVVFFFALARLATQTWKRTAHSISKLRIILEFGIIMVPSVLSVNVANGYVFPFVAVMTLGTLVIVWRTKCMEKAREREFVFGKRPCVLTLGRATINLLTALCILAIDFNGFPKVFRKSRTFGAGLMDVGIGLFIHSMGIVSKRPRRSTNITRKMYDVAQLLLIGISRTIFVTVIKYPQDKHEYGVHFNAFFILGITKLFGTLLSAAVTEGVELLFIGAGLLILHECAMQLGLSDYVMNPAVLRTTFWGANREGLCSLPGFVSLYLISMYIGQWLQDKETLSFYEFKRKLRALSIACGFLWNITLASIFVVGIARVTCNFGYVVWILAIAVSMILLFMIVFDLVLDTIWPVYRTSVESDLEKATLTKFGLPLEAVEKHKFSMRVPVIVDAINSHGLLYFFVANVITGSVNIFLKPKMCSTSESIIILTLHMLISTGFVFIFYQPTRNLRTI